MQVSRVCLAITCLLACGFPAVAADTKPPPGQVVRVPPEDAMPILGTPVTGPDGKTVGRLVDVLVSAAGMPEAAIIDVGGFMGVGTRKIAVHWDALHFDPGDQKQPIIITLTLDQIKAAPEYRSATRPAPVLVSPHPSTTPANAAPAASTTGAASNQGNGAPTQTSPAPNQSIPAANQGKAGPGQGTAAPNQSPAGQAPNQRTPAPNQSAAGQAPSQGAAAANQGTAGQPPNQGATSQAPNQGTAAQAPGTGTPGQNANPSPVAAGPAGQPQTPASGATPIAGATLPHTGAPATAVNSTTQKPPPTSQ